jgi:hypothetical protein
MDRKIHEFCSQSVLWPYISDKKSSLETITIDANPEFWIPAPATIVRSTFTLKDLDVAEK